MSMRQNDDPDILEKLELLARQASKEKSHYNVAAVVGEAHREITRLRRRLDNVMRSIQENIG